MDGESSRLVIEADQQYWGWVDADQLQARQDRPADYRAENRALVRLSRTLSQAPDKLLRTLAELVIDLCGADSAAIVFLDLDQLGAERSYCQATAGDLAEQGGLVAASRWRLSKAVVESDAIRLYRPPPLDPPNQTLSPSIVEALLIPFQVRGGPPAAVWAVSHDPAIRFDAEDARRLESIVRFAAIAYQSVSDINELREARTTPAENESYRRFAAEAERKTAQGRRLAIVELADRIRDLENPAEIAQSSVEIIGRTLGASWAALGVLDPVTDLISVEQGWTSPGVPPLAGEISFGEHARYRQALDRGEPVVATSPEGGANGMVIYRPPSARTGPMWVMALHGPASRWWSVEDLAFVREAAERTREAIERRRAEHDLLDLAQWLEREVETRTAEWSRLWRNSRDLLLVMDNIGILRGANPAWTSVLGWSPQEVVGRRFADFAHPEDHAENRAAFSMIAGGLSASVETRHKHRDGGYRWISWMAAPEDDLIYATGRHITAEKEAAAALEETQTRFRTFFETSYQYRALVSLEGVLLEVNTTALAAAGASRDAVIGLDLWRTPWFATTPGIPDAVRAAVAMVATGEIRREDILLKLPAAGWRWLDFTLRPLNDSRGDTVAIVLEAVDITERRETEIVLRQSQKLEAMGQLTGGVAHDFNNLLTPIIGGLDMLQRRGLASERERRLVDGALQSAERAKTLVQRLLAFARRQPLRTGPIDMAVLIAGVGDLVTSTVGHQIQVTMDAPVGLPAAEGDANQLEMAILNLSVNARDAMPHGGSLSIEAADELIGLGHRTALPPGRYIRLSVSDTGMGMDEVTLTRAIEPFFSTKDPGRGTGLGLSMAHGLASQLGGALAISSKPGLGTRVELWLPTSADTPSTPRLASARPANPAPAGRVLLVDDETLARETTAAMLTDMGYTVIEAANGEDALLIIDSERPIDLLITDHLMPGMTGAELARIFLTRRPGIPALIITGYAEAIPLEVPHLTKPFRLTDLAESLAGLTERAPA